MYLYKMDLCRKDTNEHLPGVLVYSKKALGMSTYPYSKPAFRVRVYPSLSDAVGAHRIQ